MKRFFKFAVLLFASAAMGLTACEPDPVEPTPVDPFEGASLEVKLVGADIDRATVSVTAEVLKAVGYVVMPAEGEMTAPTAEDIFTNGRLDNVVDGKVQFIIRNLEPETNYVAYFAGRISGKEVWDQVKEFKFKTAAEPVIPELKAKLESTDATSATINIYAENVSRIAYLLKEVEDGQMPEAPSMQVAFATGKVMALVQGDNQLVVKNLSPNTEYVAFIAGEIAGIEEYMEEIVTVKYIKTTDFADAIAIRDLNYRGFTVDIKVDPKVKEQNHVIKWATSSLYLYSRNIGSPDAFIMNLNDEAWGGMNLFNESTSIIVDDEHSYIYDPYTGEIVNYYYDTIVPGQPQVFIAGEYRRGESEFGWGMGYYRPLFDEDAWLYEQNKYTEPIDQAPFWNGFYAHLDVQVQKPEPLPAELLKVEIDKVPDDATIKITADESIDQVAIMVLSELEYNTAMTLIRPEHLQWFATSLEAMYEGVAMTLDPYSPEMGLNGSFQTAISEFLLDVPRESKFWVYVVGLRGDFNGDGYIDGNEQVLSANEFYLPQPTKPAPELEVVALESTPYEVSFNIKCPTKDADRGCSIANYEKEWLMAGLTGQELLDAYGSMFAFSTLDLMKINSDEGLTLTYRSRPNEKTYFAAMVANDEGTETFSETVIARSLQEPAAEKVDSELFESLQGEWTASATVAYSIYDAEKEDYVPQTATHTCDVTIGDFEYPETLAEEHYAIFERHGVDREQADAYYSEFKVAAKTFLDNTHNQNRILMNGFDFTGGHEAFYSYSDPFSLFISDTYNGLTSEMPLYDFGPKWFIEVAADGSASVPFNTNYFTPMSSWYTSQQAVYESHMIAYDPINGTPVAYVGDAEGNAVNGHFPVEISEDGNTITVKPLVHSGINYYANAALYYGSGQYAMNYKITSEITLTRKTSATAAPAKVARKSGKVQKQTVRANQKIETPARPASRTAFFEVPVSKHVEGIQDLSAEERGRLWRENRRNAGRR